MAAVDKVLLASKFRGTLVGALLGDCLGAPYEDVASISKRQLQTYFDKMESTQVKGKVQETSSSRFQESKFETCRQNGKNLIRKIF